MSSFFIKCLFCTAVILNIISSAQTASVESKNLFHDKLVISGEAGPTFSFTDFKATGINLAVRFSTEYFFKHFDIHSFGFKLFAEKGFLSSSDENKVPDNFSSDFSGLGLGAVYQIDFDQMYFPYLFIGLKKFWFDPRDKNGNDLPNNAFNRYSKSELGIVVELGMRSALSEKFLINFGGNWNISNTDWIDDQKLGVNDDGYLNLFVGISYLFDIGSRTDKKNDQPERKNEIHEKIKPVEKEDSDSDKDGVFDSNDKCPDTPPNIKVDANGCPLDSDNDLVPDYMDNCPDTELNVAVDSRGCPIDSDDDGIPDFKDACPDTPAEILVDENGCPEDSDLDSVPDYKDKCPETLIGMIVDEKGCPLNQIRSEEEITKNEIIPPAENNADKSSSVVIYFLKGKASLDRFSFVDLDKVAETMLAIPETDWLITGHTDDSEVALKEELSLQRANFIYNYLVRKGVSDRRLRVETKADLEPAADNSSEEGKSKNRRVEIFRLK